MGGEMRREKSLRIGVHHANGVVWEPVRAGTHLSLAASRLSRRRRRRLGLELPPLLLDERARDAVRGRLRVREQRP
eukprot:29974-Pelagococcus_subviridis.AAC.3